MSDKPHRTFKVTARWLKSRLHACPYGVSTMRGFLPAEVSTDPESNIALAIRLVREGQGHRVFWLSRHVRISYGTETVAPLPPQDCFPYDYALAPAVDDVFVIAQVLAMVADVVLGAKGL